MKKMMSIWVAGVLAVATVAGAQDTPAAAAQAPKPPAVREPKEQVPIKMQLVLSRYQGEKKLSSVPYILWVTANDSSIRSTSLRMGVQVPMITSGTTLNYRDVGTNIDCNIVSGNEGRYKVTLTVSDSSVYSADGERPGSLTASGSPTLRSFTSSFSILMRDGQTAQYTSATDQVSGEVLKIDATLSVLK